MINVAEEGGAEGRKEGEETSGEERRGRPKGGKAGGRQGRQRVVGATRGDKKCGDASKEAPELLTETEVVAGRRQQTEVFE